MGFWVLDFGLGIRLARKERLSVINSAARRQRNNREIGLRVSAAQVLITSQKLKNQQKKNNFLDFNFAKLTRKIANIQNLKSQARNSISGYCKNPKSQI
ncbi:hypothetical protein [Microcoleus sp. D3_18a_C4]|uniref:hypothetical protein n=1 Tax=unclassified Microcoleus TaxID=2642155 RepID=UPI002FCFDA6A